MTIQPTISRSECRRALSNIELSVDGGRRLPAKVFRSSPSCFFFDSDRLFEPEFLGKAVSLLKLEKAEAVCLLNLDQSSEAEWADRIFCIDRDTVQEDFRALLRGPEPGRGWVNDFGRYACSSDVGQWCLYCERRNEIGVFAIQEGVQLEHYRPILREFGAVQIAEALKNPPGFGFSSEAISPSWRVDLLREYQLLRSVLPG